MNKLSNLGMTYRIRDRGRKINIFDKLNDIKKKLNQILPEIEEHRLLSMMSHIRRHYERKNKQNSVELTPLERLLYDFLLREKLNPSTTYRWFLAGRVPYDIKEKLEKKQISVKKAMEINYNRTRVRESNLGLSMLEDMRMIVRGL